MEQQPRAMATMSAEQLSRRDSALDMHDRTSIPGGCICKAERCTSTQRCIFLRERSSSATVFKPSAHSCKVFKQGFMQSKGMSWFKKLASVPCKRLFARSGAEVHDSSGLDQAVSMYLYAAAHPQFQQGH